MRTVEKRYVFRFVRIGYIKYMEMVTETGRNVTVNTLSMLVQERVIRVYEKKKRKEERRRRVKPEDKTRVAGRRGAKENRCVPVGHIFQAGNLRWRTRYYI